MKTTSPSDMNCHGPQNPDGVPECLHSPTGDFGDCPDCAGTGRVAACSDWSTYGCKHPGDTCDQVERDDCESYPCRACSGTGARTCERCRDDAMDAAYERSVGA